MYQYFCIQVISIVVTCFTLFGACQRYYGTENNQPISTSTENIPISVPEEKWVAYIQLLNQSITEVNQSLTIQLLNMTSSLSTALETKFQKIQKESEQHIALLIESLRYNLTNQTVNCTEEHRLVRQQFKQHVEDLSEKDNMNSERIQKQFIDVKTKFYEDLSMMKQELLNRIGKLETSNQELQKDNKGKFGQLEHQTSIDKAELRTLIQSCTDKQVSDQAKQDGEIISLSKMVNSLEKSLAGVEERLVNNSESDEDLKNTFSQFVLNTSYEHADFSSEIVFLKKQLDIIKSDQGKSRRNLKNLERGLKRRLSIQENAFGSFVTQTDRDTQEHADRLDSLGDQLVTLQRQLQTLIQQFEKSESEQNSRIETTYTRTVGIESDVKIRQDFRYQMEFFISGFSCCFGLCALLYMLYWRPRGGGGAVYHRDPVENHTSQTVSSLAHAVQNKDDGDNSVGMTELEEDMEVILCPSICVVGFSESTISTHEQCARSVCDGFVLHTHVVHSVKQMALIPRDALCLVFVDFNERNVILEETGLIQGELRVKTVKYLLKRGADVFVVYTGDKESAALNAQHLYNSNLTSVQKHDVLSTLKRRNRVLSIDSGFSRLQQRVLTGAVSNLTVL